MWDMSPHFLSHHLWSSLSGQLCVHSKLRSRGRRQRRDRRSVWRGRRRRRHQERGGETECVVAAGCPVVMWSCGHVTCPLSLRITADWSRTKTSRTRTVTHLETPAITVPTSPTATRKTQTTMDRETPATRTSTETVRQRDFHPSICRDRRTETRESEEITGNSWSLRMWRVSGSGGETGRMFSCCSWGPTDCNTHGSLRGALTGCGTESGFMWAWEASVWVDLSLLRVFRYS